MNTFTKKERISSKLKIEKLFQSGKSFTHFPFRIIWLGIPFSGVKAEIVISVPKRLFKKAVDRNRIKRQIRESYRKNKTILSDESILTTVQIVFIYTSKTALESKEIEQKVISALELLSKKQCQQQKENV